MSAEDIESWARFLGLLEERRGIASAPLEEQRIEALSERFPIPEAVAALLRQGYPKEPLRLGDRALFLDPKELLEEELKPGSEAHGLPLIEAWQSTDALFLFGPEEGGVVIRERAYDFREEALAPAGREALGPFLDRLRVLLEVLEEGRIEEAGPLRWLRPEAEEELRLALGEEAGPLLDFLWIKTLRKAAWEHAKIARVVGSLALIGLAGCGLAAAYWGLTEDPSWVVLLFALPSAFFLLFGGPLYFASRDWAKALRAAGADLSRLGEEAPPFEPYVGRNTGGLKPESDPD